MASEFSDFLHSKRIDRGFTLRDFCRKTGANSVYWSALERGHAPAPIEEEFYLKIKKLLNLSDEDFNNLLKLKETHSWTPEPKLF
jgi:transcriptional regulator with XRE-family HTH domain